jgi:vitamin B12 transporter
MDQTALQQKSILPELNRLRWLVPLLCCFAGKVFAQSKDSASVLKTVHINAVTTGNNFTGSAPVQTLNHETLQQINAASIGDAARYFSGALIKDYGGNGGLKTISVRSLGASSTGILYDGIPVSDMQTGQVDLSRYSTTFIQSLELQQGGIQHALMPARANASAATLAIATNTYTAANFNQQKWQAGIRAGSFNLWQPFAGLYQPLKKNTVVSINAEALYSKGNYPFFIDNGNFSSKTKRDNSDIKSLQGEASLLKQFNDSAVLEIKAGAYTAERGLPGAIVFFNSRSVQRLWNTDVFTQGRYQKKLTPATTVLLSAKYNYNYTRYTDPDFLNNQGGLDSRYRQQEIYASVAADHSFFKNFTVSAASDVSFSRASANTKNFASPSRKTFWENLGLQYADPLLRINASLLYTGINDHTVNGTNAGNKNKFMPTVALGFVPAAASPFLFRAFYKASFRMPTFNDLYYNFIGNNSLKPEYAKQYNIGITWSKQFSAAIKKAGISADVYYNEINDKIIAVPGQNLFVWTMLNLGKVSIKGIDLNAEARGSFPGAVGWFTRLAYTWQRAQDITDKSSASYESRIPYTPDHSGSALLAINYQKWETGYSMLFSGTRYALGDNNPYNQLDGWFTADAYISKTIPVHNARMAVKAELNNISGERFDIIRYYPMPGRSFKLSLLFNNL